MKAVPFIFIAWGLIWLTKLEANRKLHFKSHKQADEILVTADGKWWRWCFTHERYEPTSFL